MRTIVITDITALSLLAPVGTAGAAEPAGPPTRVIGSTGATQNVTVPDGVSTVSIWTYGGGGAEVALVLPVEQGQVLTLAVGGAGATAGYNGATEPTGGWGGTASGGTGITSHPDGSSGGGGGPRRCPWGTPR